MGGLRSAARAIRRVQTFQNVVSTRYFDAMSIPLLRAAQFTAQDDDRSPLVAILNQTLAQMLWPARIRWASG